MISKWKEFVYNIVFYYMLVMLKIICKSTLNHHLSTHPEYQIPPLSAGY